MRAQRYRLRFVTGVSISAATYGSDTYGGTITYGQKASDPVSSYRYRLIPLPAGGPTDPSWIYRHADISRNHIGFTTYGSDTYGGVITYGQGGTYNMTAQVIGDEGPLVMVGVEKARFVLTAVDTRDPFPIQLDAGWDADGVLFHIFTADDPPIDVGQYRVALVMNYTSGRRHTVPADDNIHLVVTP